MLIILNNKSDKPGLGVYADPILAVLFAKIERFVRLFDRRLQRSERVDRRNAAAGGETHLLPVGQIQRQAMGAGAQLLHDVPRVVQRTVAQQHRELFATLAAEDVAGAKRALQQMAEFHQRPVTDIVAVAVVELFEVVDIDQAKGLRVAPVAQ